MVRVNTTLTSLCVVLVLGAACTAPTPPEPVHETPRSVRQALGEGPASRVADLATTANTALVRYPSSLSVSGSTLLFSAGDETLGPELWRLTASGPALVDDIIPGPTGSSPSNLFSTQGLTWFSATDGQHGLELWRTDGTPSGTALLADIRPGADSSRPSGFTGFNGWIFFRADDGVHGVELWRTDGTAEGTQLVRDILLGSGDSNPQSFTELNGALYFLANGPGGIRQLWSTDGSAKGTNAVTSQVTVSDAPPVRGLVKLGRTLFFAGSEGTNGTELWKSDGTAAGTVRVADLVSGNNTTEGPDSLVATSTRLFFMMRDSTGVASALYATDGTAAGTLKLVDFKALGGNGPLQMMAHGGTLYFSGFEPSVAYEVWTSDGTSAGTQRLGGGAGLIPGRAQDPAPSEFTEQGDTVYFVANAPGTGLSDDYPPIPTLWKTQGSTATTVPVGAELQPTQGSNPAPFASWNGALYFTTFEQDAAASLWRSDGTAAGTLPLATVVPGSAPRFEAPLGLSALTPLSDALYFTAFDSSTASFTLWKTKGTAATTGQVSSLVTLSTATSFPIELATHAGALFFAGQDTSHGFELWTSDGTSAGTTLVRDIVSEGGSSSPSSFTDTAGALYFLARQPTGRELWKTDGTAAGTVRVVDIRDSLGNAGIISIAGVMGGSLYFVANQDGTGIELWKTDGTTTTQVKDIAPGTQDSSPSHFAVLGTTLYFTANDGSSGTELWKSDGTAAGTSLVKDILPGAAGGVLAESLFALSTEKLLLFAANDGVSGTELWRSDGTAAGTFLLHDIAPLQLGSDPSGFTFFGGNIVFSANDGLHGREPWIMARALLTNSTPPHITCPANQKVEAQQALGAQVAFPDATATDDTSIPPALVYSRSQGSFFPFGVTSVTAVARDAAGLTDSCVFTVEVRDTTPPDVVCPVNVTAEAMDATGAIVSYSAPYATDAVTRGITPTASPASGTRFPQGNTTVTVTARDAAGNAGQCTFTVRVQDTTAAVLTCPSDQIVEAEDATGALATWPAPTATDPVSTPTVTSKPVMGSRFSLGTTPVVVTATDAAGNTSSCTFRVLVRDTQAPTLSCPAPVQVEALGPTGAPADFVVTNYTDTVSTVTVSTDPKSGSTFPVGVTSVRVQAQDLSGNTTECTFPVRVVDTLPPLLTCPQDLNVAKGPAAVTLPQPSVKDRVTVSPSIDMDPASGSVFQVGDTPVTVTARDDAGNSAQCTFTVHVDKAQGGCSSAPDSADALTWLAMLCLLLLATRRRAPSSPRGS